MEHCTKKPGDEKAIPTFGPDRIEMAMRLRIRDTIEELVPQELEAALGAVKSARGPKVRIGGRRERVPVLVTLGRAGEWGPGGARPAVGRRGKCSELDRGGCASRRAPPRAASPGRDRRESWPE